MDPVLGPQGRRGPRRRFRFRHRTAAPRSAPAWSMDGPLAPSSRHQVPSHTPAGAYRAHAHLPSTNTEQLARQKWFQKHNRKPWLPWALAVHTHSQKVRGEGQSPPGGQGWKVQTPTGDPPGVWSHRPVSPLGRGPSLAQAARRLFAHQRGGRWLSVERPGLGQPWVLGGTQGRGPGHQAGRSYERSEGWVSLSSGERPPLEMSTPA